MMTHCIVDVERDVSMKNLSPKEAITILEGMRINTPLPKAAVMQSKRNAAIDMAIDTLKYSEMPNSSDSISRQAAIDAFLTELTKRERKNLLHTWSTVEVKYFVVDMLEKLPSAQPEPLTDKEQRIFLAAMGREEKVCKQVDEECRDWRSE